MIIITIYYPISSKLKFIYSDIKNIYSEDGKYLKHFNGNGIWIKDEIDNKVYIINGVSKNYPFLEDVFISKFNPETSLINWTPKSIPFFIILDFLVSKDNGIFFG